MSKLSRRTEVVAAKPEVLMRLADAGGVSALWLMVGRGPVHAVPASHGMLRTHPQWAEVLAEAKKRQRGIPNEFWNMAGDSVLQSPHLDWQFLIGLVRELYSIHQRLETVEDSPRRSPKK